MSAVFGPNSYLPGQKLEPPKDQVCDVHADRKAIVRVVGECDSFGSEASDLCEECLQEVEASIESKGGVCECCSCHSNRLRPIRDPEEGSAGPVYLMCDTCISKIVHGTTSMSSMAETGLDDLDIEITEDEEEDDYRCSIEQEDIPSPLNFHTPNRW